MLLTSREQQWYTLEEQVWWTWPSFLKCPLWEISTDLVSSDPSLWVIHCWKIPKIPWNQHIRMWLLAWASSHLISYWCHRECWLRIADLPPGTASKSQMSGSESATRHGGFCPHCPVVFKARGYGASWSLSGVLCWPTIHMSFLYKKKKLLKILRMVEGITWIEEYMGNKLGGYIFLENRNRMEGTGTEKKGREERICE